MTFKLRHLELKKFLTSIKETNKQKRKEIKTFTERDKNENKSTNNKCDKSIYKVEYHF